MLKLITIAIPVFLLIGVARIFAFEITTNENIEGIPVDSANCPGVRILTPSERSQVKEEFRANIVDIVGLQKKKALGLALDMLPPFVCKSVRRVVFIKGGIPGDDGTLAWVNPSRPDLINIASITQTSENALTPKTTSSGLEKRRLVELWLRLIRSIIHEANHTATFLIENSTDNKRTGTDNRWKSDATQAADRIVSKLKLKDGFVDEWERISESFIDMKYSSKYDKTRASNETTEPPLGFMTKYGGNKPSEDIAEAAAWVSVKPLFETSFFGVTPNVSNWNYACRKLQATSTIGIPSNLAAIYTKLLFLRDLGFITDESLKGCIGSGTIGLKKLDKKGFQFFQNKTWKPFTAFTENAKIVRTSNEFELISKGTLGSGNDARQTTMLLEFRVDESQYPRGIYKIIRCKIFPLPAPGILAPKVTFRRIVTGAKSKSLCAYRAQILVTEASSEKIKGSVFLQAAWKFSFLPVPEVTGFPVHVVFNF